ncbi:hypothetical protein OCU04_006704 [Sclerotinia nivalis]|uniref:Uncharacterized protein n=1 Tax=Sclerotinia nivalis TaxID=352851 RepID=A0A9X0AKF3_9HELO|nr:hypothetical protein OCU04_006704 [Sclerotinia nivalis]
MLLRYFRLQMSESADMLTIARTLSIDIAIKLLSYVVYEIKSPDYRHDASLDGDFPLPMINILAPGMSEKRYASPSWACSYTLVKT